MTDAINPNHYRSHPSGVECIQITEHMDFCIGNAVKYLWRCGQKGDAIEDLKKAAWYIQCKIDLLERQRRDEVECLVPAPFDVDSLKPGDRVMVQLDSKDESRGLGKAGDVVKVTFEAFFGGGSLMWCLSKRGKSFIVDRKQIIGFGTASEDG